MASMQDHHVWWPHTTWGNCPSHASRVKPAWAGMSAAGRAKAARVSYCVPHRCASRRTAVGLAGCAPRFVPNRGHPALIPDASGPLGPARCACPKAGVCSGRGVGGLAVPFTVSRRSRRQGRRAPCALASWRPSATPDCLRCAVLATVPGNSARATGDRHERQITRFPRTACLPRLRHGVRYRRYPAGQAPAREHGVPYGDGWGLCPEHQKLSDDGFVALLECDPQCSGSQAGGRMKPEQA